MHHFYTDDMSFIPVLHFSVVIGPPSLKSTYLPTGTDNEMLEYFFLIGFLPVKPSTGYLPVCLSLGGTYVVNVVTVLALSGSNLSS